MSNYNTQLQSNNTDLQAVIQILQNKTASGGEQAAPVISINNSNGLIIATAGTKTSTHQLAFQEAKTITPSTASQIAVSSGYYTGGNITVAGDSNLIASNIVSGKTIFGVAGTATVGNDPFASASPFTYTVNAISNAQYGFTKNSNGYYESQNKGQNSSYAICRVNLNVASSCDIIFDVINYAESNYDYAVFGNLDIALALSNTADSTAKENFKGRQSASIVNVTYSGVTAGSHYIDIKFIKDNSQHNNNDSVQFKLQEQNSLSQETINKILAADTDLVSENIKSGVDIFGITGTYAGSGGSTDVEDGFVTGNLSTYSNDRITSTRTHAFINCKSLTSISLPNVTSIAAYAFGNCTSLTSVSFPVVTSIDVHAFESCASLTSVNFPKAKFIAYSAFLWCTSLTSVSFPAATTIGSYAFHNCINLTSVNFPKVTTIGSSAFDSCSSLTSVSFPVATKISSGAFARCSNLTSISLPKVTNISYNAFLSCSSLTSIYLMASTRCALSDSNAFSNTGIWSNKGSIYVPSSLVASYKTATNWAFFSNRIFSAP